MSASKDHRLGFAGAVQGMSTLEVEFESESLPLRKAHHDRTNTDVTAALSTRREGYVQTIPGDTVSLEFEAASTPLHDGERETYLFRSSGFYTALREENRQLAGNWRSRLSEEAKSRLPSLRSLRTYG
jgi:hypothetical protein